MQKRKTYLLAALIVSINLVVFLSGCTLQQPPQLPRGNELKTCAELGGYECDASETCPENWVDASDSFRCCSCDCESDIDEAEFLEIDLFDETPENEDFGAVYD